MAKDKIVLDIDIMNLWIRNPGIAWYPLMGGKDFDCPQRDLDVWDKLVNKHRKTGELHPLCDSCYKPRITITGNFNQENLNNIASMLNSWEIPFLGKMNDKNIYFYFRYQNQAGGFTEYLKEETEKWGVAHSGIDWQKGCSKYWHVCPQAWKDEKEYLGRIARPNLFKQVFS